MAQTVIHPTKPLACWPKARELRESYYRKYAQEGRLRCAGGGWSFDSLLAGLGDDIVFLAGEPYGATVAYDRTFSMECMRAVEERGWSRDLCAYMRNDLGSVYLDRYALGGRYPRPDFLIQGHICCTHAKWYQALAEYLDVPLFCVDVGVGPYHEMTPNGLDYVVAQLHECIEWMERITGRRYDDERLFSAVEQECRAANLWAQICALNKAVPAPLDEKTMHTFFVLTVLYKASKEIADFLEVLRDEVQGRVAMGIAAVPVERRRVITDIQPPWAFMDLFKHLQRYGAVSVGNLYVFGLIGIWEDQPDGTWGPAKTPRQRGIRIQSRDQALRLLAEWSLRKPLYDQFYDHQYKTQMLLRVVREWRVDGVILHYNRGCEGLSLGIAENRLGLAKAGIPTMAYEGNMADEREFDLEATYRRLDAFMASLGLESGSNLHA